MKAELRLSDHSLLRRHNVIEIWYDGEMVATVTGADGPGVRVISKYPLYPKVLKSIPYICEVETILEG